MKEGWSIMRTFKASLVLLALLIAGAQGSPRPLPVEQCLDNRTFGLASTRISGILFVAVWQRVDAGNEWIDFLSNEGGRWNRLSTIRNDTYAWQSISSLPDGRIDGFVVRSEAEGFWYGNSKVFVVLQGRVKQVFDNLAPTEIIDLNHDGYPELIASSWPDGDGTPQTSEVYVWEKDTYKKLLTVRFRHRYSATVVARINKHLHGTR